VNILDKGDAAMIALAASDKIRLIVLVNRYALPLAIILIVFGVVFSQPLAHVQNISIGLIVFTTIMNLGVVEIVKRSPKIMPWLIKLRLYINLGINAYLVYILGGYWPPIWLLLCLTPIATAVYGTRGKTLFTALGISVLLLGIHAMRGLNAPVDWGQQAACVCFIILLSLMINDISHFVRKVQQRGQSNII